eukprot:645381-Pelagomonas_calceolata.AAC.2
MCHHKDVDCGCMRHHSSCMQQNLHAVQQHYSICLMGILHAAAAAAAAAAIYKHVREKRNAPLLTTKQVQGSLHRSVI